MKILVTGGAGYIGSHMVKLLCDNDYSVKVVDNLINGFREVIDPRAEFHNTSLSEKDQLVSILGDCDVVMHFAGLIQAGESMDSPEIYFENNVAQGIVLLEAMREAGVKKIIFSSTAALYGSPKYLPIDEEHPESPENFYGFTKQIFEQILKWYEKLFGFKYICLRYFNAAGAGDLGDFHKKETHLIPKVLNALNGKEPEFKIYGSDYDTFDGTCIRDYIHVDDLCSAHLHALKYLFDKQKSNYFNLGTGKGISVKEIIATCEEVTGRKINCKLSERRAGDPPNLVASNNKARSILSWEPKSSSIKNIILTSWDWRNKNHF